MEGSQEDPLIFTALSVTCLQVITVLQTSCNVMVHGNTRPLVRYGLHVGTASLTATTFTLPSTLDLMCIQGYSLVE